MSFNVCLNYCLALETNPLNNLFDLFYDLDFIFLSDDKTISLNYRLIEIINIYYFIQVNSVPTVVAIKNGKSVDKLVGLIDDDKIRSFVKKAVE